MRVRWLIHANHIFHSRLYCMVKHKGTIIIVSYPAGGFPQRTICPAENCPKVICNYGTSSKHITPKNMTS